MLGIISKKKAMKKIVMMIFLPVVLMIGWGVLSGTLEQLSIFEKVVAVIGGGLIVIIILLTTTVFGREVFASLIGDFLHDFIKAMFLGFRNVGRFLFGRWR
jgi:choline-glycine betaine transporter